MHAMGPIQSEHASSIRPFDYNPGTTQSKRGDSMAGNVLEGEDPEQADMMDEMCILVDEDDKPIGSASKLDCHRAVSYTHLRAHET